MLETFQYSSIDVSVYIILFGALILYFGKVIGDVKVESYGRLGYSIEGVFFFFMYNFLPFIFAYYVKEMFNLPFWILLSIQIFIIFALFLNFMANEFRRHGLLENFKSRVEDKVNKTKKRESFLGCLIKSKESLVKTQFGLSYTELGILAYYTIPIKIFGNKMTLFMFSFLAILPNFYWFKSEVSLPFGISIVFTFIILTMIASAYGFGNAYYPPAKIYMDNGEIIEGKILKFGDFIYLLKRDKKIFINKDKINHVEESLFKEKER
jgi:hypothetical protein